MLNLKMKGNAFAFGWRFRVHLEARIDRIFMTGAIVFKACEDQSFETFCRCAILPQVL